MPTVLSNGCAVSQPQALTGLAGSSMQASTVPLGIDSNAEHGGPMQQVCALTIFTALVAMAVIDGTLCIFFVGRASTRK